MTRMFADGDLYRVRVDGIDSYIVGPYTEMGAARRAVTKAKKEFQWFHRGKEDTSTYTIEKANIKWEAV